ncbi:hypothetical protein [Nonomuraea longicatena]|uniref:Uncharacterized protein n=1 Tax=Nonomuraea longicatena TaxID=83682 RepID=A0ABN1RCG5_9ACTN
MASLSDRSVRLLGQNFLSTVGVDDLFPAYAPVLDRGWAILGDAVVLVGWHESYRGDRARFPTTLDYEISVNGRAIPDLDLLEEGEARAGSLLRRGAAFAWAALHEQYRQLPEVRMIAYVSAAPTLFDPDYFTGNVTFCSMRPGGSSYMNPVDGAMEFVISLVTDDCVTSLD